MTKFSKLINKIRQYFSKYEDFLGIDPADKNGVIVIGRYNKKTGIIEIDDIKTHPNDYCKDLEEHAKEVGKRK